MGTFHYYTADVFTDTRFGGNQLAVFPDARGISEDILLSIAREFNYAETTFVFPPENPAHTRRLRIFTPGNEMQFAGHPTVGTAHVLAAIGAIPLTGDLTHIVFEEGVGPVSVAIHSRDGRSEFCQLSVATLPEAGPVPASREKLAEVLGLDVDDLLDGQWAPQAFSCGVRFLFIPVVDRRAVARVRIRADAWEQTQARAWAPDLFVFARGGERTGTDFHARCFVPGMGVPEDAATGSANAALAGYLAARDERRNGTLRWRVEQGFEMHRPSILEVEADVSDGRITAARVGGATVLVCEGEMNVG